MNSQNDCQIRLQNLQSYIPFLQQMVDRLASSQDIPKVEQRKKLNSLLELITSSGKK